MAWSSLRNQYDGSSKVFLQIIQIDLCSLSSQEQLIDILPAKHRQNVLDPLLHSKINVPTHFGLKVNDHIQWSHKRPDDNVNESRTESFLPEKKEKLRRQDRETSEESSRGRSRGSREKKPRSKERKGYLLRDSPSPTHNNPREHISRKTAHYKETWWEENEEALRGWKKVSPHFLPSTSGSSEPQLGAEESRSSSLAPLPQQTLQKPTPMKEEPKEDMEDASNVPSTSGMATLPVERLIKEEQVHEMKEAWYAPPRPPRPFN
ncbi:unnamed protein product [Caenorhabditis brenneri]